MLARWKVHPSHRLKNSGIPWTEVMKKHRMLRPSMMSLSNNNVDASVYHFDFSKKEMKNALPRFSGMYIYIMFTSFGAEIKVVQIGVVGNYSCSLCAETFCSKAIGLACLWLFGVGNCFALAIPDQLLF